MSQVLKFNSVSFTDTTLPVLGDYGAINGMSLETSIKVQASTLLNDGLAAGALTSAGTATGAYLPSYSAGILSIPDADPQSTYNRYTVPVNLTGLPVTYAILYRKVAARALYLFQSPGGGVNIYMRSTNNVMQGIFSNGTLRTPDISPPIASNVWNCILVSISATEILVALNGVDLTPVTFASQGGAPAATSGRVIALGDTSIGLSMHGDVAGLFVWNRAMDATERRSTYRAVRALAATKGITV